MSTDPKALAEEVLAERGPGAETQMGSPNWHRARELAKAYLALESRTPAAAGVDMGLWLGHWLAKEFEQFDRDEVRSDGYWNDRGRSLASALLSSGILGESAGAADKAPAGAPAWLPIESAPTKNGATVMLAVRDFGDGWIVGEAHLIVEEETGGSEWWWANEGPGDYHAEAIQCRHGSPLYWQPLPSPPHDGVRTAAPHALEKVSTDG